MIRFIKDYLGGFKKFYSHKINKVIRIKNLSKISSGTIDYPQFVTMFLIINS